MSDNVVLLRPKVAPPDPYADLNARRLSFIAAWQAWLNSRPLHCDVQQEIHGTTVTLRSLADLTAARQEGTGS